MLFLIKNMQAQPTITPTNYHVDTTRVSNSGITRLLKSPAHYYQTYLAPDREPFDTAAFRLGRAFHVACSEPDTFFDRYIVAPGSIDRRTTDGKRRWADFEAVAQGKTILQERPAQYEDGRKARTLSYEQVMRMRDALMAHPIAAHLMQAGKAEQVILVDDYQTGTPCKAMLDWLPNAGRFILDFKSTDDASPAGFRRSVIKYGYDRQAAFYTDAMWANTGHEYTFIFAAVETRPPFLCELYAIQPDGLQGAREQIQNALQAYNNCLQTGVWHGYSEDRKIKWIEI